MTWHTVIEAPSNIGAQQITQRAKQEKRVDLVQRAGSMFGKLEKRWSFDCDGKPQKDKGQIIGCGGDVFLIHSNGDSYPVILSKKKRVKVAFTRFRF
jgi:hypothetical protein